MSPAGVAPVPSMSTELFSRMLGQSLAMAGQTDEALRWLGIAVERGFINYPFLARHDPLLASVRKTEPFRELMARVRERCEAFELSESLEIP